MNIHRAEVYERKPEDFLPSVEVSAIFVNVEDKLLFLQLSQRKVEVGTWCVPAGKLEKNETPLAGAKRELFEETGIDIALEERFQFKATFYIRKPDIDYVYHLFEIHLEQEPMIQLSDEHVSHQWVSRKEAERLPLMSGGGRILDLYCQYYSKKTSLLSLAND